MRLILGADGREILVPEIKDGKRYALLQRPDESGEEFLYRLGLAEEYKEQLKAKFGRE